MNKLNRLIFLGVLLCIAVSANARDILVLGLFKNMAIVRIDDNQHKLRIGQVSPEGVKLISADSEQAVLEIDGVQQTFTLGSHQSSQHFEQTKTVSEAKIWADRGMYQTAGSINGHPVSFLVDTGASSVAMNTAHAKRLGINYRYAGRKSAASTASGIVNTYLVNLDRVKVGGIELRNIEGAVVEGQGPSTILLGMSFLRHVKMQRDGNLLQLQKQH